MKNEFMKKLEEDEELLFYGVADVSKTGKQLGKFLLLCVVLGGFWAVLILALKNNGILSIMPLVIVLASFTTLSMYGLVYNLFLKYKNKNNEYFVTNKRIALYNSSKKDFRIEYISKIENMGLVRENNNYGDIIFNFHESSLMEQAKNGMCFEGVENPRRVVSLITNTNKNIHTYDDGPTIKGIKI